MVVPSVHKAVVAWLFAWCFAIWRKASYAGDGPRVGSARLDFCSILQDRLLNIWCKLVETPFRFVSIHNDLVVGQVVRDTEGGRLILRHSHHNDYQWYKRQPSPLMDGCLLFGGGGAKEDVEVAPPAVDVVVALWYCLQQ
jgi:hypothetical protein